MTICPISSHLTGNYLFRVPMPQEADTGLRIDSEVEVDKITTVWVRRIGRIVGRANDDTMDQVDIALRRWLDL